MQWNNHPVTCLHPHGITQRLKASFLSLWVPNGWFWRGGRNYDSHRLNNWSSPARNTTMMAGACQKFLQSSLGGLHQYKWQSQWSVYSKGGKEWTDHWDFRHIKEIWRSQFCKGVTMVTAMHAVLAKAKVHRRPRRYFKRRRVCTFCEIVISKMWRFGAIFFSHYLSPSGPPNTGLLQLIFLDILITLAWKTVTGTIPEFYNQL